MMNKFLFPPRSVTEIKNTISNRDHEPLINLVTFKNCPDQEIVKNSSIMVEKGIVYDVGSNSLYFLTCSFRLNYPWGTIQDVIDSHCRNCSACFPTAAAPENHYDCTDNCTNFSKYPSKNSPINSYELHKNIIKESIISPSGTLKRKNEEEKENKTDDNNISPSFSHFSTSSPSNFNDQSKNSSSSSSSTMDVAGKRKIDLLNGEKNNIIIIKPSLCFENNNNSDFKSRCETNNISTDEIKLNNDEDISEFENRQYTGGEDTVKTWLSIEKNALTTTEDEVHTVNRNKISVEENSGNNSATNGIVGTMKDYVSEDYAFIDLNRVVYDEFVEGEYSENLSISGQCSENSGNRSMDKSISYESRNVDEIYDLRTVSRYHDTNLAVGGSNMDVLIQIKKLGFERSTVKEVIKSLRRKGFNEPTLDQFLAEAQFYP